MIIIIGKTPFFLAIAVLRIFSQIASGFYSLDFETVIIFTEQDRQPRV
jgi:hypothetical protein